MLIVKCLEVVMVCIIKAASFSLFDRVRLAQK